LQTAWFSHYKILGTKNEKDFYHCSGNRHGSFIGNRKRLVGQRLE
jgi:hypothetical protein